VVSLFDRDPCSHAFHAKSAGQAYEQSLPAWCTERSYNCHNTDTSERRVQELELLQCNRNGLIKLCRSTTASSVSTLALRTRNGDSSVAAETTGQRSDLSCAQYTAACPSSSASGSWQCSRQTRCERSASPDTCTDGLRHTAALEDLRSLCKSDSPGLAEEALHVTLLTASRPSSAAAQPDPQKY
jgi:hypothetical protein